MINALVEWFPLIVSVISMMVALVSLALVVYLGRFAKEERRRARQRFLLALDAIGQGK
jgi:hypothetical protein